MAKINLQEHYPFHEGGNCTIEVSDEIAAVFQDAKRQEKNYRWRVWWHKAFYSLDLHGGSIENDALSLSPSPEEIYERELEIEELHTALNSLPDKQRRRIHAHYILGMTKSEIAQAEGVDESTVRESIESGLHRLKRILKNNF